MFLGLYTWAGSDSDETNTISYLFSCSTLEHLHTKFGTAWARINPTAKKLPFLKILELHFLTLNDEFMQWLMLGSPLLEKLVLDSCLLDVSKEVSSSSLKILKIEYSTLVRNSRLWISFPNLVDLYYSGSWERICFGNLASVECAFLSIHTRGVDYNGEVIEVLKSLSNANSLQLYGFIYFKMELADLHVFKNLKSLEFDSFVMQNNEFRQIALFLRRTPNLDKLTVRCIRPTKGRTLRRTVYNEIHQGCLKTLEIVGSENDQTHVLVEYLCNGFMTLENFKVDPANSIDGADSD